jgi:hypothetical protein
MQAPGMPEEDREGGFDQGGWQATLLKGDLADEVARLKQTYNECTPRAAATWCKA